CAKRAAGSAGRAEARHGRAPSARVERTSGGAMTKLWQHGAGELAAMIAARKVSSAEVVDAHLARIDAVNPALNAVTRVLAEDARAAAAAADRAVASGGPLGP